MERQLIEGTTHFVTDSDGKITKDMTVFYNPVMKFNRDLTLAVLLAMQEQREGGAKESRGLRIGLPLEASGVRAARILHELLPPGYMPVNLIAINDRSKTAVDCAKKNIAHNIGAFDPALVNISCLEANEFLRKSPGFDYIDIDPFGTPNPFLDSAVQKIVPNGILAVTATDTAALAGTYPAATVRKYWAIPSRTWSMHDVGLRILIRKVQLVAAQYDKALVPVLSVATDHYYRIFFSCVRAKDAVKQVFKQHQFLHVCTACMQLTVAQQNIGLCVNCGTAIQAAGPLWAGTLHDKTFVQTMLSAARKLDAVTAKELEKFLEIIVDECKLNVVGFIDLHELGSRLKIAAPRTDAVLDRLGGHACRTHINGAAVRSDIVMKEFVKLLQ